MSDAARQHKDRGTQLLARGKLPAALAEFQKVVAAVPGDLGARQKVAEILAKLGKKSEAIAAYEAVVRRYADAGQFFKATALCKVILGLDPAHAATQASLAKLYAGRRPAEAPVPPPRPTAPTPPLELSALLAQSRAEPLDFDLDIDVDVALPEIPIEVEVPAPKVELPAIPLFSDLSRDQFVQVLNLIEPRAYLPGEAIVTEGAPGEAMFAIAQGRVGVVRTVAGQPARRVAQMDEGDFFGEMALLSDAPRLATVVAETPTVVLEFTRAKVEALIARHPQVGEALGRFHRDRLLQNLLRSSPLLHPLSDAQKAEVALHFQSRVYAPGDPIIEEGLPGEAVYLLLRGSARAFHRDPPRDEVRYPLMREGDSFGEISVVTGRPATATVEAVGPVVLLWIPAQVFRDQVLVHPAVKAMVMQQVNERLERTAAHDLRV